MNRLIVAQTLEHILGWEGGFVDHPDDAGGPTNFGITMPTLKRWLGREVTYDDIKGLDRQTAINIYDEFYINQTIYEKLTDPWTFKYIIDMGVLHAPKTVAKIVQKASHPLTKVDGIFGNQTLSVANSLSSDKDIYPQWQVKLRVERTYHYARRVRNDPTQAIFLLGWLKRAHAL